MAFSAPRAASDHGTLQRVPHPGTKALFGGRVIMQVFVQPRGNRVLHGSFYRVGGESRAHPLSEARRASTIIPWAAAQLSHTCLGSHPTQRGLSEGGVLPVLA